MESARTYYCDFGGSNEASSSSFFFYIPFFGPKEGHRCKGGWGFPIIFWGLIVLFPIMFVNLFP